MKAVGISDIGRCRKNNEDSYRIRSGGDSAHNLFVVADGMGGCNAGEIASSSAVDAFLRCTEEKEKNTRPSEIPDLLAEGIAAANKAVFEKAGTKEEFSEMGTTMVAAAVREDRVYVAYAGDSRAYLFHEGRLKPLTTDHSYVMELVKMGSITKEEAAEHPKRNIITRAVGVKESVETDSVTADVCGGDLLLLCTDGLSGMLSDAAMQMLLQKELSVEEKASLLVAEANRLGGYDNISLILVEI